MKFRPKMNISSFPYNRDFFSARGENLIVHTSEFLVYFKNRDGDFRKHVSNEGDDKLSNLIKCLQEFKSSMEFRNCDSNANKV